VRTIRASVTVACLAIIATVSAGGAALGQEPVTLTFWDLEEGAATQARAQLIEEFEAANPHITVDHVVRGFDDLNATIRFALQGENAPDVAAINQGFNPMGVLVEAGLLEPLDAYAAQYGWNDRFPSTVLRLNSFEPDGSAFGSGELYGLSTTAEIVGIFYNKAKLAELGLEVPATVDEFVAAVQAAQERYGESVAFGNLEKNPGFHLFTTLQMAYADPEAATDWVLRDRPGLSFVTEDNLQAAELLQELALEGVFTPEYNSISRDDAAQSFASGDGTFLMGHGSWKVGEMAAGLGDDVGFMLMPRESADEGHAAIGSGGIAFGIASGSERKEEAAKFLDFITSERAGGLYTQSGGLPAGPSDQPPTEQVAVDAQAAFDEMRETNRLIPFEDWATTTMLETMRDSVQELMAGRIEPSEYLDRIQADYEAAAS
jgi:raffinose/stachyose/melibiose transport system substrate-binding protein